MYGLTSHSTQQVISETSLSRQSIALVLTTKNNQTQHYIHQKHKRETEKAALANKTIHPDLVRLLRPPVRKRTFQRRSSQPITWLVLVNKIKQQPNYNRNNLNENIQITKNLFTRD